MPLVGAPGETRDADENIRNIISEVKNEAVSKAGINAEEFTPLKYRSQLVNGVNYFIKVRTAPDQHVHLRVHKSFQGEITLAAFQLDKSEDDELEYFQ